MDLYFNKFPKITYNNTEVRDITRRVVLPQSLRDVATSFYPYTIIDGMRSDVIAHTYYKDADVDYLIYITNGIVDPYYGWYLTNEQFIEFIKQKYGSIDYAQQKVSYWEVNWLGEEINIAVARYQSFPEIIKKYWQPVIGAQNRIVSYKRSPLDWTVNTNKIVKVTVESTVGFTRQLVHAKHSGEIVGFAEIVDVVDSTTLIINNVIGTWNESYSLISRDNDNILTTISSLTTLAENISDNEIAYWRPVYVYDDEFAENEDKKTILLLDAAHLYNASQGIADKLKE